MRTQACERIASLALKELRSELQSVARKDSLASVRDVARFCLSILDRGYHARREGKVVEVGTYDAGELLMFRMQFPANDAAIRRALKKELARWRYSGCP